MDRGGVNRSPVLSSRNSELAFVHLKLAKNFRSGSMERTWKWEPDVHRTMKGDSQELGVSIGQQREVLGVDDPICRPVSLQSRSCKYRGMPVCAQLLCVHVISMWTSLKFLSSPEASRSITLQKTPTFHYLGPAKVSDGNRRCSSVNRVLLCLEFKNPWVQSPAELLKNKKAQCDSALLYSQPSRGGGR